MDKPERSGNVILTQDGLLVTISIGRLLAPVTFGLTVNEALDLRDVLGAKFPEQHEESESMADE